MRLDPQRMAHAFGIAGSLCGGLLAFSAAGSGGAVKPLHMGRAAEAGVFAAQLAADGYEGPLGILEGKFGVLQAFARDADVSRLTAGLGTSWEIQNVCFKKYSCHIMAQTVVEGLRDLVTANQVEPRSVESIELGVAEKVLSHHANREPNDIGTSQYSVPMCAAIALFRDPADPRSFFADPHADQNIRAMARKVALVHLSETEKPGMTLLTRITLRLTSGRTLETEKSEFQGMRMSSASDLVFGKFDRLAGPRLQQAQSLRRTLDSFESIAAFSRSTLLEDSSARATATQRCTAVDRPA
jgi:2-methylcitrate dehydratase PrpD